MDLPIDLNELREIVVSLETTQNNNELADRLKLICMLLETDGNYKKTLREKYNIVA